jgi:hypothetical protein
MYVFTQAQLSDVHFQWCGILCYRIPVRTTKDPVLKEVLLQYKKHAPVITPLTNKQF